MRAKVVAVTQSLAFGVPVFIGRAGAESTFVDVVSGQGAGTYFGGSAASAVSKRRQWIGLHGNAAGSVAVDAGAVAALTHGKKSLLAVGIVGVTGRFDKEALVEVVSAEDGEVIARGISALSSEEIVASSKERHRGIEVINRDELVVVSRGV
jgi:glutamate 5-kinase